MSTRKRSRSYWARKVHRYLGLFIGVQFIAWTVGGLYFSWTNLDEVHGDHLQAPRPHLRGDVPLVSPGSVLEAIRLREPVDSLVGINLAEVLGTPTYRVQYFRALSGAVSWRMRRQEVCELSWDGMKQCGSRSVDSRIQPQSGRWNI